MNPKIIAGVDIGGTKTQVMVTRDGEVVADEVISTESWRVLQMDADAQSLADIVRKLANGEEPASIAVGAHGCDTDEQCRQFQALIAERVAGRVQVVNDSELLVPAAGYFQGIGVVSGTGSIAVARTTDGKMLAAGGWGWILGDEGSAPALVRDAAKAIRGAIDAGDTTDPLIAALMAELNTKDPTKLGRLLNDVRGAVVWGRHASAVFKAADEGSKLADAVITEGGKALAALVAVLVKRGANAERVVAGGGVIAEQPLLMSAFRTAMAEIAPKSEVLLLRKPPVIGAIALAAHNLH